MLTYRLVLMLLEKEGNMINEQKTKTITEIREEIDLIDGKLAELLEERLAMVIDMALLKSTLGLPIYDEKREKEVIRKNCKGEYLIFLERIYEGIMRESRRVQDSLWHY